MKLYVNQDRQCGSRFLSNRSRARVNLLVACGVAFCLSGCASTDNKVEQSAGRKSLSADEAFVFPPVGGPPIVGVIQEKRSGRTHQEILLGTNSAVRGQNRIEVTIARNAPTVVNPYPRIVVQARAALPGIRMSPSAYYVQNRYGPFGYAMGRGTSNELCLFGWQTIRSKASPMTNQGSIDIRLRLCETGSTEQQLLSVMYGYTVDAFMSSNQWNPYGIPLPPDPELGKRGADINPFGSDPSTRFAIAAPPAAEPVRRPARPKAAEPQPIAVAPVATPRPAAPPVPAPPVSSAPLDTQSQELPAVPVAPRVPMPPTEN